MRVAHLSDCYLPRLGGIEVQVHDLARAQRATGVDAEVVTATPRARHDRTSLEHVDGVPVHRLTADLPWELPVHPRAAAVLDPLLADGAYDVVHVHTGVVSPFAWSGVRAALRRGLPVVVTLHCLWGPGSRLSYAAAQRVAGFARWPVLWSAVSQAAAAPLQTVLGPAATARVIPNGIDAAQWQVEPASRDPRDVRLVAVMRLAGRKRPVPMLRALADVRRRLDPAVVLRVTVAGEGPARSSMERFLARHDMASWVHLPGRLDRVEIKDLYARADGFVASADLESFGIAALEARCAGVPVVAKRRTGISEFVEDMRHGLLADDDAGLAEAVLRLAGDTPLRTTLAATSRAEPPPVSWPQVVARTVDAYESAVALRANAGPLR